MVWAGDLEVTWLWQKVCRFALFKKGARAQAIVVCVARELRGEGEYAHAGCCDRKTMVSVMMKGGGASLSAKTRVCFSLLCVTKRRAV